jgi:TonB-dependent SusC/RagA subfamily outer membrane receptor
MASAEAFNHLDFNQVKSLNVLKDNASAYLSRIQGAPVLADKYSGVIVINTKKGLTGAVTPGAGINEVEVVGYGRSMRQSDTTGSLSSQLRLKGAAGPNDPLIIVDGKERSSINSIDPNDIETVSILKDARGINAYSAYGEKAKNGVIIVTTKEGANNNLYVDEPLIVIDGKIETEKSLKQISADEIERFNVLKPASAILLYGQKAKNGAIIITTKKK